MGEWCTIESDPGVFTELVSKIGVKDVQVEELWSLEDDDFLRKLEPVYGLIFLFKWTGEHDGRPVMTDDSNGVFFARQTITNACATQALLSILLNSPNVDIGDTLDNFRSFAIDLTPEMRGDAINQLEEVRIAHNSFNRQEPFLADDKRSGGKSDDVFHFIAYIPHEGFIYELDGLKEGPIQLGPYDEGKWIDAARPHIQERIVRYSSSEIRFNLMAVIRDQRVVLREKMDKHAKRIDQLEALEDAEAMSDANFTPFDLDQDEGFQKLVSSNDKPSIKAQIEFDKKKHREYKNELLGIEQKFKDWTEENIRRKHNYIPFAIQLLKEIGKADKLKEMIEKASEKRQERMRQQQGSKA